jgi:CRP/FNR family transcriptional regulator
LLGERLAGSYAQALTPTTILSINHEELMRLFRRTPEVAMKLTKLLARRLREADERLADISLKKVPARLASLLVQLVESEGIVTREGYRRISIRYTHDRLATMIGAGRVAVTRAFASLREEGILELRDRQIVVKDMQALEQAARG